MGHGVNRVAKMCARAMRTTGGPHHRAGALGIPNWASRHRRLLADRRWQLAPQMDPCTKIMLSKQPLILLSDSRNSRTKSRASAVITPEPRCWGLLTAAPRSPPHFNAFELSRFPGNP